MPKQWITLSCSQTQEIPAFKLCARLVKVRTPPRTPTQEPEYHPAQKDSILNSWEIVYAVRWHNIFEIPPPWNVLCYPDAWHIRKIHKECRNCRTQNHTRKTESSVPALVLSNAPEAHWWQHLPHLCVRHMPLPSPSQCSKSRIAVLGSAKRRYTLQKMWSEPLLKSRVESHPQFPLPFLASAMTFAQMAHIVSVR